MRDIAPYLVFQDAAWYDIISPIVANPDYQPEQWDPIRRIFHSLKGNNRIAELIRAERAEGHPKGSRRSDISKRPTVVDDEAHQVEETATSTKKK